MNYGINWSTILHLVLITGWFLRYENYEKYMTRFMFLKKATQTAFVSYLYGYQTINTKE